MTIRRSITRRSLGAGIFWAFYAGRGDSQGDPLVTIDALLNQFVELGMFNGVVRIDRRGRTVFDRAYGLADYERGTPFAARTRFRIASISKPMTDAALAAMASRGELRLDDTLDRYLPQFPAANRITLDLITRHRSGIPHTNNQPWGDGSIVLSHDEVLRRLAAMPLDFEPGARRSYSNGGYAVLARVMEMAARKPYLEIMRELVFNPVGMRDAGEILNSHTPIERLAEGYLPGVVIGERQQARFYAAETRQGGGSLYASANDVLFFFQEAWRGRLEGAQAYPSLFGGTGATLAADGRAPGYYIDVHYQRDADLLVCSTANNYASETYWAKSIALLALGLQPMLAGIPPLELSRRANDAWLGRYRFEQPYYSQNIELSRGNSGQLLMTDHTTPGGDRRAMLPLLDGGYLDPLYYWACHMNVADRIELSNLYPSDFSTALIRT